MRNVAILAETSLASGRQILAGISRYLHEHDDWNVFHQTGPLGALNPRAIESWNGDGIIARIADRRIHRLVRDKGAPVVDVLGNVAESEFPRVTCDEEAIARLVADDLRERGYRHFAFFGLKGERWSVTRAQSFRRHCLDGGGESCAALMIDHRDRQAAPWARYLGRLRAWLKGLPKPLGLMVASDQFGPDIAEACRQSGLMVPD
jgi:LacI family transcriptional regulator